MIGRRTFLAGAAAVPLTIAAEAQPRRPLLGVLLTGNERAGAGYEWSGPLRRALAALGWVEGRTIDIAVRQADNQFERLPSLAAQLVMLKPDVILTHGGTGSRAAAEATASIPIVVGAASEEAILAYAGNLSRPARNLTGLSLVSVEQHAKCIELYEEMQPGQRRIGVLVNPFSQAYRDFPSSLVELLPNRARDVTRVEAHDVATVEMAGAALQAWRADGLLVTSDPAFNQPPIDHALAALATRGIGAIGTFDALPRAGGLFSLGASYPALALRAAVYVDRILKGVRPADLPVERPTTFTTVINLRTAKTLGIDIPASLIARADEVIE